MLRRRPVQLTLMFTGFIAGWTASAAAGLPPAPPPPITIPSVTIPTVTVPPVPVPPPPVPVPQPPVPQLPQAPPAPTVPGVTLPSVQQPPAVSGGKSSGSGTGSGVSGSAGSGGDSAQSSGGAVQSRRAAASSTRVYRLRLARDWISRSGSNKQRRTTLVFVLRKPTLLEFVVIRVAPTCRRIGRFRVQGHRGVNRVRLGSRVGRHSLSAGTYRIVARALPGGRTISDTRLVVVENASREAIRKARSANSCPRAAMSGSDTSSSPVDPAVDSRSGAAKSQKTGQIARYRGALGARFVKVAAGTFAGTSPWLYALIGVAIAVLAAAALPQRVVPGPAAAMFLAERRALLAAVGAGVLTGTAVAFVLQ